MELFELLNDEMEPLTIKDLKAFVLESSRSAFELWVIMAEGGGVRFVPVEESGDCDTILLSQVIEGAEDEYPDVPDDEVCLYVGTDDEGQHIFALAPLGYLSRSESN